MQHRMAVGADRKQIIEWVCFATATPSEKLLMVNVDEAPAKITVAFAEVHFAAQAPHALRIDTGCAG